MNGSQRDKKRLVAGRAHWASPYRSRWSGQDTVGLQGVGNLALGDDIRVQCRLAHHQDGREGLRFRRA